MSDNIDIKIREDGSRTVSRDLDKLADTADKTSTAFSRLSKSVQETSKSASLTNYNSLTNTIEKVASANVLLSNAQMKVAASAAPLAKAVSSYNALLTTSVPVIEKLAGANVLLASSNEKYSASIGTASSAVGQYNSLLMGVLPVVEKVLAGNTLLAGSNERYAASIAPVTKSVAQYNGLLMNSVPIVEKVASGNMLLANANEKYATSLPGVNKAVTQYNSLLGITVPAVEKLAADNMLLTNSITAVSSSFASADKALVHYNALLNTTSKNVVKLAADNMLLTNSKVVEPTKTISAASTGSRDSLMNTVAQASAVKNLSQSSNELSSSTKQATAYQYQWNSASREAHGLARGLSGSLGALWLTYGSILPLMAGAALGSAFIGAAKAGSEMAYQLTFVKALGGESADAIERLKQSALDLSSNSSFRPTEIASGYRILAQAGLSANESLATMPSVLNLATAGELKMEEAGIAVVGTLNAFKLGIEDAAHVSDLFAKASAASQASVQDLTQSMKYGSTVGTQYKQSVDDTMAALALLAKVNVMGTSAGTAYRNMLKEIYTPTKDAAKAWAGLGISMEKTMKGPDGQSIQKVKSFVEVINELRDKMNKLDEPSQIRLKGFLGGERGSKEMVAMLDLTKQQWDEFYSKIAQDSKGFAKKVADDVNATAKNEWKHALNALEVELASSFLRMEGPMIGLAQQFKGIFQSEEFTTALDSILKVMVGAIDIFLKFSGVLYELAKAWLVLKAAQTGAALATMLSATATAAQGLAGGMLAASGAMGPVARGVTVLGPLLTALGGPLAIILSLLAAGAAAWFLWGQNSETASGKAIKTADEKLKALKQAEKHGGGQLGAERIELENLEAIYNLRNKTMGLDRKHVDEAYKAVQVQQQVVDLMEKQQKFEQPKVVVPKIPEVNPVGKDKWFVPEKTPKGGAGKNAGRLNDDDNALAKLQARLLIAEKEYGVISLTGEAQFQLNEGNKKALEIQEKLSELQQKGTAGLEAKGLKQNAAQVASLKEQFFVASELGKQLQQNEILKVNTKIEDEVRITKLLPLAREEENKYLQFRNELLGKGAMLDAAGVTALREKVAAQIELNKVTSARDQFLANSDAQQSKDFTIQNKGLMDAQKSPDWTKNDTDKSTGAMMQGMGIDTNKMQEQRNVELNQLEIYHARLKQMKADQLINEEQYQSGRYQLMAKTNQIQMSGMDQFFGQLSTLQNSSNKKLGAIGKAAAMAQATMQGYVAVQNALAVQPYYLGMALAVGAGVSAAANVAKIAGVNFATGGSFVVGGSGGVDSQQVSMRASPGERVTVATPTQVRKGDELNNRNQKQGSGASGDNNIKIVNVVDPNMLQDYLSTPAGERVLVNTIQRNAGAIRNVMNG